jgi:DNA replication and repair protein RecF
MRLAAHRMVADRLSSTPVLLLDDVLSELDPQRAAALLHHLPDGQVVLTTAGALPPAAVPDETMTVHGGRVVLETEFDGNRSGTAD